MQENQQGHLFLVNYQKSEMYTKTNTSVKKVLGDFILQHTHSMQSSIPNNYVKVSIDIHTEKQVVPKVLL